jgi:hypothetical protein
LKVERRFNLILNKESSRQTLKGRTAVKKSYHTVNKQGKVNEQKLAEFLSRSGQMLLPMVDLIEQCQWACDELIDVTGRAAFQEQSCNYRLSRWREGRRNRESAGVETWFSMASNREW